MKVAIDCLIKYLNESFKEYIFKCVASVGHIKNLPYKKLSVDVKNNYEADFQIIDDENNLKTVNNIKSLARKYKNVILATDQDREGERIAYDLAILLKLDFRKSNFWVSWLIVILILVKPLIIKIVLIILYLKVKIIKLFLI